MARQPITAEEYIASCSEEVQPILQQMRAIIRKAAPMAQEKISWGMPTYVHYGNLVHFAAAKKHVGFYPGSSGVLAFQEDLKAYSSSKGAIRLPIGEPLPEALIQKIVAYRIQEQERLWQEKQAEKKQK